MTMRVACRRLEVPSDDFHVWSNPDATGNSDDVKLSAAGGLIFSAVLCGGVERKRSLSVCQLARLLSAPVHTVDRRARDVFSWDMGWDCSAVISGDGSDQWSVGVTRLDETKWNQLSTRTLMWVMTKIVDTPEKELAEMVESDKHWLTGPPAEEDTAQPEVTHNQALDAASRPLKLSAQREDGQPVEPGTRLFVLRTDLLTESQTLNADAYLATCVLKAYIREAIHCGKFMEAQTALTHLAAGLTGVDMATAALMDVTISYESYPGGLENEASGPISGLEEFPHIARVTGICIPGVSQRF